VIRAGEYKTLIIVFIFSEYGKDSCYWRCYA